jgi:hypothetical protein
MVPSGYSASKISIPSNIGAEGDGMENGSR